MEDIEFHKIKNKIMLKQIKRKTYNCVVDINEHIIWINKLWLVIIIEMVPYCYGKFLKIICP